MGLFSLAGLDGPVLYRNFVPLGLALLALRLTDPPHAAAPMSTTREGAVCRQEAEREAPGPVVPPIR